MYQQQYPNKESIVRGLLWAIRFQEIQMIRRPSRQMHLPRTVRRKICRRKTRPLLALPRNTLNSPYPKAWLMDEAQTADFKSFAKEQGLTQEQAQKVLDFGGVKIKEMIEAPYKTWRETQEKWQAEVKADPEIGGTKFEQSIKDSALVFEPNESNPFVGSAEEAKALREALNTTGAGNNPAVVKLFVKMGKLLAEPGTFTGKPTAVDKQGDILAKMYPTMSEGSS